jgi:hypothetical protein
MSNSKRDPDFQVRRMEDLCTTGLPDQQIQICQERLDKSYDELIADHPSIGTHTTLSKCFRRAAMGYPFVPGSKGVCKPYLCQEDALELRTRMLDAVDNFVPLKVPDVLEQAYRLQIQRPDSAIAWLTRVKSDQLADSPAKKGVVRIAKRRDAF